MKLDLRGLTDVTDEKTAVINGKCIAQRIDKNWSEIPVRSLLFYKRLSNGFRYLKVCDSPINEFYTFLEQLKQLAQKDGVEILTGD